ncbi:hypothetical protein [Inhella proteolytica]|uniref:Uncharacterized protein n=1 Tax=Inhella proteolytica TaxID=2795029 RepID=A0A931J345_9BURK|nr:hypothetical protein [Inhella proteolytica]MBH9576674.1 hypothetical protein [Inhella proteolytica]
MQHLTPEQVALVDRLAHSLYQVVPARYKTYCAVTAGVCLRVLQACGVPAQLQPCQLWHLGPHHNHVIGFIGGRHKPGTWDGHVVCAAGHLLIETAAQHFDVQFGLPCPWVVVTPRVELPTQALARAELSEGNSLMWMQPPPDVDPTPPHEPDDLVQGLARQLLARLHPAGGRVGAASLHTALLPAQRPATRSQLKP